MKKNIVALVARALFTLFLTFGLANAEDAPQLQKLKHTVISPTTEQVVLQLNGSYSPKVFTLKDETPRIIFDFAGATYGREIKGVTTTNGNIVKRVRVGMHTDGAPKTRVVFDLTTLKGVSYTQKIDEKNSSLIIQFTGPEKIAAQRKAQTQPPDEAAKTQPVAATEPPQEQREPVQVEKNMLTEPPPAVETTAAKLESPQPAEKAAPAPQKEPDQLIAQKAAEKTPVSPPAQAKPETSTAAKPIEKLETPQVTDVAKPEKEKKEAIAAAPSGEKKEEKKTEPVTKESPRPEAVLESKAVTKPEGAKTEGKSKTEEAKPVVTAQTMEGPELEYVKFDASSPKGEMVMFKLNGFHPPVVHGVEEGIPRVICDFNNTKLTGSAKNLIKTDGKFVKIIRTSKTKKPEKIRVVIDLEPNRSYDLQQVFFKEDNLFVIIVNTVKK